LLAFHAMRHLLVRDFYLSVHNLLASRQAAGGDNRRSRERRPYVQWEAVAPLPGDELPGLDRFLPVRCVDLSESGFSFFSRRPTAESQLVVAFGHPSGTIYLTAQVLHQVPCQEAGQSGFRIGCHFTGRLTGPPEIPNSPSPLLGPAR
jgi:hypothetical protein